MSDFTPCPDCADPDWCASRYPDDDKHKPGEVRGCFAEKSRTIMPRSMRTAPWHQAEKEQSKDMDAYKRLRQDGVQPTQIMGSSVLEQVEERHIIERRADPKALERREIPDTYSERRKAGK